MVFAFILHAETKDMIKRSCKFCNSKLNVSLPVIPTYPVLHYCQTCKCDYDCESIEMSYRLFLTVKVEGQDKLVNAVAFDNIVVEMVGLKANDYEYLNRNGEGGIDKVLESRLLGQWIDVEIKENINAYQDKGFSILEKKKERMILSNNGDFPLFFAV